MIRFTALHDDGEDLTTGTTATAFRLHFDLLCFFMNKLD